MRFIIALGLLGLSLGCAQPLVVVIPGVAQEDGSSAHKSPRLPDDCPYTRVAITHSQNVETMSTEDLVVTSKVAELMRKEFRRSGATITDSPAEAYWSLMVLAVADHRHFEGFIFSASLNLRDLHEGHDPGITTYKARNSSETPILYSGLGFGPGYALEETVQEFVQRADATLLPTARSLCRSVELETQREGELEAHLPVPL